MQTLFVGAAYAYSTSDSLVLKGFVLYSDTDTIVGLPRPIHESIKTLKQVLQNYYLCSADDSYSQRYSSVI